MKRITNETPCTHLQNENSIFIGNAIKSCVSCCAVILHCICYNVCINALMEPIILIGD